jgi:hypothetical protein
MVSGGVGLFVPAVTIIVVVVVVVVVPTEWKFCEYTLQFRSPQH